MLSVYKIGKMFHTLQLLAPEHLQESCMLSFNLPGSLIVSVFCMSNRYNALVMVTGFKNVHSTAL